jgi:putative ABC transport system permease protein
MLYVRRVLRRLRSITPLDALQGSAGLNPGKRRPRPMLKQGIGKRVTGKMAWAKIRMSPSQHITILVVACLITLSLLIPFRFGATARSSDFVTYMGMGEYDLRIDLLGQDDALLTADSIVAVLNDDEHVSRIAVYTQEVESATAANGEIYPLRVDYGDQTTFPLRYGDGRAPETETELGLSEINAERFEVGVGDTVTIFGATGPGEFTVSGTYQDITNGGKTAKAIPGPTMDDDQPDIMIAIEAANGASLEDIATTINEVVNDVQVIETGTYVQQMLGGIVEVMDTIAWVFSLVAVLLAGLIAALSVRLMQVQDRKANAIQGALGFTSRHLRQQYMMRILPMIAIGVVLGIILATPVGNLIGNFLFSTVGISGLSLKFNLFATVAGGLGVLLSAWIVTLLHTRSEFNADIPARLQG